ncbi:MAG: response regulator [Microcoleus sp. PH2017_29_MFU_D_A]|jgi:signal transduction histidine kinase|uniref:sensor histidine kinase n=1 Tax=unclassified Microcoleus TaxID=2642155 RepID=UPI001E17B745|nr:MULTISPECIES: response regulator [unclassified Microcoleus]MCC3457143.1 response regulator [Microcoleus sp. PH2017_08_TRC_O_A]MCC3605694.1 response regulator [Microcoleus sp. PH2017_29_MFU_D_A]MCC3636619.1 response regulator [Microcoleus sp. PH2017_37_MFU_D_B]TAE65698.1 MAG: hybrid sensor histidine kinase/response regulator [Oscillatoriales cyanobacterium]
MSEAELILVVDDTPANLDVISEALTDAGYEVAIAIDGERALKQVQYTLPSLILLDVMMPGINGFETCRRLKASEATKDIPVMFMTALSDTADKIKGFQLGAVDYITKPFEEMEVLARVNTHIKLRNLNKELEQRVADRTAELTAALIQVKQSQLQLIQSEKMSALGNLVAGVAHEINNPVGFIYGNIKELNLAIKDIFRHLQLYQQECPNPGKDIEIHAADIDLEYVLKDTAKMLSSMEVGCDRLRNISTSLRTFSRADTAVKVSANICDGIDSTLMILQHRLKAQDTRPEIQVIKKYGEIPPIKCYLGQLNQVFMNVISNAIDAVNECSYGRNFAEIAVACNTIIITTELTQDRERVVIKIKDNGKGISDDVKSHIFDHLFTTKLVGEGTGLGLSISRQIVEEIHGGSLTCSSVLGEGAQFAIALPID